MATSTECRCSCMCGRIGRLRRNTLTLIIVGEKPGGEKRISETFVLRRLDLS